MKFKILLAFLLTPFLLFANVGTILAVKGEASITRNSKQIKAITNTIVENGDTITTFDYSKLQVKFKDNTVITIGKNSTFKITDFEYSSKNKKKNKFGVKFGKGLFKSITGAIGKINQKRFKIQTRSASIGIRGTTILVESLDNQPDIIACVAGEIEVRALNTNFSVIVPAGKLTKIKVGEEPTTPRAYKANEVNKIEKNKEKSSVIKTNKNDITKNTSVQSKEQSKEKNKEESVKTEKSQTIKVEDEGSIEVEDQDINIDNVVENITQVTQSIAEVQETAVDAVKEVEEEVIIDPLTDIPEFPILK